MATRRSGSKQTGESTPFDNDGTTLTSTETGPAIRELALSVSSSASPGFSFGRASSVNSGTWLQCETVPSNKAGRLVYISNAVVETIFISSENISTYDVAIYHHDGDEVNLTLLDTVSVVSSRGGSFTIGLAVATDKQLALRVTSGSTRNIVCGLELSGTD